MNSTPVQPTRKTKTMSKLPTDDNNNAIQTLAFKGDTAQQIAIGASSAKNGTDFAATTRTLMVTPTVDCHIVQGNQTATATTSSHFLKGGQPYPIARNNCTRIAVIRATEDGTLHISEME